jgi:hypothetical protein
MVDKRMLIVPAELVRKIDENRGDMSQAEFIEFLINSQLQETKEKTKEHQYVTKDELRVFQEDVKGLLRRALDFFVSYGLELGKQAPKSEFDELTSRLHELEEDLTSEGETKEAKIKWK